MVLRRNVEILVLPQCGRRSSEREQMQRKAVEEDHPRVSLVSPQCVRLVEFGIFSVCETGGAVASSVWD